ncbi:Ig-like domain-containing protein [Streptacidiphilus sp. EB129]|uniref:Ig-like domain-containing protein n=1 Tax=Streptacidiphilus sp. EB129 TaxID=3156262 RepID=UPI0035146808
MRQRSANARRIAASGRIAAGTAAAAAVVVLSGGAAHASTVTELRARPGDSAGAAAFDRADAVSGRAVGIDLLADEPVSAPGARATVALTAQAVHGHVVLGDDGTATYRSLPGFTGTDSFGYRISDEQGHGSRVTVAVTVSADTEPGSGHGLAAYAA